MATAAAGKAAAATVVSVLTGDEVMECGGVVCGVVLVDCGGVMEAAGWSWWCGDRRLPAAVCGSTGCSGDEGGVRVVDLIDHDTGSLFGLCRKRSPKKFFAGDGGSGGGRQLASDGRRGESRGEMTVTI
nr:hypothetical protein [Tanacetum cinerariifolium]